MADSDEIDINMFTPPEVAAQQAEEAAKAAEVVVEDESAQRAEDGEQGDAGREEGVQEEELADKRPKRTTADRIKRLAQERNAAREEGEALRAELAALKAGKETPLTTPPDAAKESGVQAPDPEKYKYGELDPQFIRDTARYEASELLKAELENERKSREDSRQAEAAEREVAQLREQATKVETAGAKAYEDFQDVVVEGAKLGDYPLTKEMFTAALDTSVPEHILYHLASHPEEALAVSKMDERALGRWIGKMEVKFETPVAQPRKISNAPEPLSPTRGSGGGNQVKGDTQDFAAFERMAKAAAKG